MLPSCRLGTAAVATDVPMCHVHYCTRRARTRTTHQRQRLLAHAHSTNTSSSLTGHVTHHSLTMHCATVPCRCAHLLAINWPMTGRSPLESVRPPCGMSPLLSSRRPEYAEATGPKIPAQSKRTAPLVSSRGPGCAGCAEAAMRAQSKKNCPLACPNKAERACTFSHLDDLLLVGLGCGLAAPA